MKGFQWVTVDRLALDSATIESVAFGGDPDLGFLPPHDYHLFGKTRKKKKIKKFRERG